YLMDGSSTLGSTGSASISIQGDAPSAEGIHLGAVGNTVGGASDTGDITLTADLMTVANATIQTGGSAVVALRPRPPRPNINIESSPTTGVLSIPQSTLALVNAPTLEIGRSDGTGTLTIAGPIGTSDVNASTLRLVSGSVVSTSASNPGANIGNSGNEFAH